jgi:hypothetical protein
MTEKKKTSLTFKVAVFGLLGASALGYAFLRRPRYLYDGQVAACEGPPDEVEQFFRKCGQLALKRGNGSGKLFAPFSGTVVSQEGNVMTIASSSEPILFHFEFERGVPKVTPGRSIKAGELIAQTDHVNVSASRQEGTQSGPVAPSAWLIANSLLPASQRGKLWCEDSHQVIVPACPGVTFRAPELPKWSLRTVRMSM